MKDRTLYSIGETARTCEVTPRMLRHYESLGLLKPDRVDPSSHYRYYSVETMRRLQTIRYLVDEGFSLEEIRDAITSDDLEGLQAKFMEKIDETQEKIEYYHQRLDSLKSWAALIIEGKQTLRHRETEIKTRFLPQQPYFYYIEDFTGSSLSPRECDAYIETRYFTQSKGYGHSMVDMGGAFHVLYDSYQDRLDGRNTKMTLLQILFPNSKSREKTMEFGGFMAVTSYHIGPLSEIGDTYRRMIEWTREHGYELEGNSCERHILDVYSTVNEDNFVTEVLLPVKGNYQELGLLHNWK